MTFTFPSGAYRFISAIVLLLGFSLSASAQTWQWGKRGGGAFDNNSLTPKEAVVDMATDKNGNLYVLAIIIKSIGNLDLDNNNLTAYGDRDIVLAKFNCNGVYKWSKVIGGAAVDYPNAVGVDTIGHVYVCGKVYDDAAPNNVHFSTDTAQQNNNHKSLFLVQYDTSGNFKWLRQPNPDTSTNMVNFSCQSYDMKVTPNGDVYWLAKLHPGLVSGGNGWVVTARRPFILQYNAAGNLVGHTDLQMETDQAAFYNIFLQRLPSGKFIVCGGQEYYAGLTSFTMGGSQVVHSLFIGMFNTSGQLLWKRENTLAARNSRISSRPLIDATGNMFLAGTISNQDTFITYGHRNFLRPSIPFTADPFLCRVDTSGNLLWMKASSGLSANYTASVAVKGANELWVSGDYTSVWWDSTYKVQTAANAGTHYFVTRFNNQGIVLGMDSVRGSTGTDNVFYCSTSDNKGNLYVGGEMVSSITVAGQTLVTKGGSSDLFFAKLGAACNCTPPVASFNKSTSSRVLTLSYTGTVTGVDSVVWNYGNGVTAKKTGTAISAGFSYTYPANGTYNVCATAYSSCGSDQNCQSVTVSGGSAVGSVAGMEQVKVFPNPASTSVSVEGLTAGATVRLLTIMGQEVSQTYTSAGTTLTIPVDAYPAGTYLIVVTDREGHKGVIRLIRQ